MIVVLVAGLVLGVAGLLGLGFGLPIKDTTFGNAILLSSIVLLCTAMILAGLAMVVRELKAVARALSQGAGGRLAQRSVLPGVASAPKRPAPANSPFAAPLQPAESPGGSDAEAEPASSESTPPWAAEAATRTRGTAGADASYPVEPPVVAEPVAPERPPRRNLLFASRRRDRPTSGPGSGDPGSMQVGPAELPPMAQPVLPPMPALEAEPQAFDSAWPARNQPPSPPPVTPEPAVAADRPAAESKPTIAGRSAPAVTVIKSGVVDGMAYSLYSDGSIEAQMPEGMLRFASLDELRAHLDSRP